MLRRLALTLPVAALLCGCSVGFTSDTPAPTPPGGSAAGTAGSTPSATASPSGSTAAANAVPGYGPGQFPPVPLFSLPDASRVSSAGKALQDRLRQQIPPTPGVEVTAVRCGADGSYVNADAGLVLYGDGSGSYVGPDGNYTVAEDGSETSITDRESVTRDGQGGGTFVSGELSITNAGDGSGTYVDAGTSVTIDGEGGGTYVSGTESITNAGDGSGTYVSGAVTITNDGQGAGTYVNGHATITNDGRGTAMVVTPSFSGEVPAAPLSPVPTLGKFPPVDQLLPKVDTCGFVITLPDGVLFDFDQATIRPDAALVVDQVAVALTEIGGRSVTIGGHTDALGDDAYNQGLSERRAASVQAALSQRGVTAPMTANGYGEARPVAPNEVQGQDYPAGRQLNRRVEIFIPS